MNSLHYLEVSGSPFAIGQQLGRFGAAVAHQYLLQSPAWASVMQWRGSLEAHQLRRQTELHFPAIAEELRGLAAGLELPEDDVFLWNCRGDLWAMAPDGCTTVLLPGGSPRLSHNEDGDPDFAGHCGVARFAPDNAPGFVSFVYPASIPGHTFAVNAHGLAMTVNNLRYLGVSPGVPRMVLARAMLRHDTLSKAVAMLEAVPRAGGFHFGLGQAGERRLLSVEFCASGVSLRDISRPELHANHAIHPAMSEQNQRITLSSQHRQERGDELLATAVTDVDPLSVLGDRHNAEFPIWRQAPDDSDNENTMATADIELTAHGARWAVYAGGIDASKGDDGRRPAFRFTGLETDG